MLRLRMFLVVSCLLTAMAGCGTVHVDKPVGERPAVLNPDDWDGRWFIQGVWFPIRVVDPEQGIIELQAPVPNEEDKLGRVEIRETGEWQFASSRPAKRSNRKAAEGVEEPTPYTWVRILNKNGQIVLWPPDAKKFAALVEAGKLPGEVKTFEVPEETVYMVQLNGLTTEHFRMIASLDEGFLFDADHPLAFVRDIPRELSEKEKAEAADPEKWREAAQARLHSKDPAAEYKAILEAKIEEAHQTGDEKAAHEAEYVLRSVVAAGALWKEWSKDRRAALAQEWKDALLEAKMSIPDEPILFATFFGKTQEDIVAVFGEPAFQNDNHKGEHTIRYDLGAVAEGDDKENRYLLFDFKDGKVTNIVSQAGSNSGDLLREDEVERH